MDRIGYHVASWQAEKAAFDRRSYGSEVETSVSGKGKFDTGQGNTTPLATSRFKVRSDPGAELLDPSRKMISL